MNILRHKLCWLLLFGGLLSGCASHDYPAPRVYEGCIIFFRDAATFYSFESRSIKLGWEVVAQPPELTGKEGCMYYLRCLGSATPYGKPVQDGGPGAPMFQPQHFRVERVLELRSPRRSDWAHNPHHGT